MLKPFRHVWSSVVGSWSSSGGEKGSDTLVSKFDYSRPDFLGLTADETQVAGDRTSRPIIVPRDISRLPWNSGYAEVINGGKSVRNEDQSSCEVFQLVDEEDLPSPDGVPGSCYTYSKEQDSIEKRLFSTTIDPEDRKVVYFAIFDGHAGSGAALYASKLLHFHIQEKMSQVQELLYKSTQEGPVRTSEIAKAMEDSGLFCDVKPVSVDELVIGALETAFHEMDVQIGKERHMYKITGGCAVIAAIVFLGKLYVANAGDCRAIISRGAHVIPMSNDFTPESERQRLQYLAWLRPHLLGNDFTHLEFQHRIMKSDVGKAVLYRGHDMKGWTYKKVTEEDTKIPLISDKGKRAKVLGTIGLTRGFGDFDLKVSDRNLYVKPFLTPTPEVQVYDLAAFDHSPDDVLIIASDGLWDITTNELAAEIVASSLSRFAETDNDRYTSAAQELVMHARGSQFHPHLGWRTHDDKPSSNDDISVFVMPLCYYQLIAKTTVPTSSSVLSRSSVGVPKDWMSPVLAAVEQDAEGMHSCMYTSGDSGLADLSYNLQELGVGHQGYDDLYLGNSDGCLQATKSTDGQRISAELPRNFQNSSETEGDGMQNIECRATSHVTSESPDQKLSPSRDDFVDVPVDVAGEQPNRQGDATADVEASAAEELPVNSKISQSPDMAEINVAEITEQVLV
ncbi:PREDICTED: protein phosphatase 1H-like [Priapulus caudatus]|uniref:Protein phosphatase 1H-like n=1 Tax=Priapulus caudatus TaxID=37621 RepID=A0ABM1DRN4_PRICU|nr:PREDICTED: protein phosphatase 1H-like [Priapulus caudatus]